MDAGDEFCVLTDISVPEHDRLSDASRRVADRAELARVLGVYAWRPPRVLTVRSRGAFRLHLCLGYYPTRVSGELGAVTAYLGGGDDGWTPRGWTARADPITAAEGAFYQCEDDWVEVRADELIPLPALIDAVAFVVERDTPPGGLGWYAPDGSPYTPADKEVPSRREMLRGLEELKEALANLKGAVPADEHS
jgi:hypothetical protein